MGDAYLDALLQDAKAFQALSPATHAEVQTYLLAFITDSSYQTGMDPETLAYASRCFGCLSQSTLLEAKVYLIADMANFVLDPNTLLYYARCYPCIPEGSFPEVITYLLSNDPNGPAITDPSLLAQSAKSFQRLSPVTLLQIQVYLLALIAEVTPDPNTIAGLSKCFRCFPYPYLLATFTQALDYLEPLPPSEDAPNRNPPPGSPHDPPTPPEHPPTTDEGGNRGGGIPVCSDDPDDLIPLLTPTYLGAVLQTADIFITRTCCKQGRYEIYRSANPDMSGVQTLVAFGDIPNRTANYTIEDVDFTGLGAGYFAAKTSCNKGDLNSEYSNIIGSTWMPYDPFETYTSGESVDGLDDGVNWTSPFAGRTSYADLRQDDDMESYANGAALNGLNGGTAWAGAYVGK